jgi:hypothetical protein
MFSEKDYGIKEDAQTKEQKRRLLSYISLGEREQRTLIEYCVRNIPRDRYVHPKFMSFGTEGVNDTQRARLVVTYKKSATTSETMLVHKHALGHLCDISGLDARYKSKLNVDSPDSWRRELLATNLKELFAKQRFVNKLKKEAEFLHRIVGNELRAVLTQSFNRHLVSTVVLQPFLEVCKECGLQPAKAHITDMRVHLQTYLPYVFQPYPGEFIALGSCWGNSDFGEGKLKISHNILRLNGLGSFITEDAFSRIHIGSVVEDTDMVLDDRVAVKELEAIAAASQSGVRQIMEPSSVQRTLEAIGQAAMEQIPWLEVKSKLNRVLNKDDVSTVEGFLTDHIVDLPQVGLGRDGNPLPSKWWAAAALAHLAEKETDGTKVMLMKALSGTFITPDKKEKHG